MCQYRFRDVLRTLSSICDGTLREISSIIGVLEGPKYTFAFDHKQESNVYFNIKILATFWLPQGDITHLCGPLQNRSEILIPSKM